MKEQIETRPACFLDWKNFSKFSIKLCLDLEPSVNRRFYTNNTDHQASKSNATEVWQMALDIYY